MKPSTLLLLLAAAFGLSLLYCPPVDFLFDDKEIFQYMGRLIAHGSIPYRDAFDHKPPLIFFFNTLGPWGLWLIDTTLVLLATFRFYRLCQGQRLPLPWLLPLLFNLLIRNYLVCLGIGMTRAYTAIFLLLFFCLLLSSNRQRYFWLGLLTAATFFMQQDQVVILLPLWLYALRTSRANHRSSAIHQSPESHPAPANPRPAALRNTLLTIAGGLTLTLPLLLYFGLHHALADFYADAFQFNFSWYTEKTSLGEHFRTTKEGLERSGVLMPFIGTIVLGALAFPGRHKNKKLLLATLAAVFLSFISEALSSRSGPAFYYYFLPLAASLPITVFVVWTGTEEPHLLGKQPQFLYGFLLCCLPLYNAGQHATHLSLHNKDIITKQPEFEYLLRRQPADRQLYIFGDNNWVLAYNRLGIFSPSPWIYQHFWGWFDNWDADHRQLRAIEASLLQYKTQYVMDYSGVMHFWDPTARTEWQTFLATWYQPVVLPGAIRQSLWQRK